MKFSGIINSFLLFNNKPNNYNRLYCNVKDFISKYVPKSENQKKYVNYLNDNKNKIIFVYGPAGTGKTLFACDKAIKELQNGKINKIIITRPIVSVEEELGFLPGDINKKMDPWMRPIYDIFSEYYTLKEIDNMINTGIIEVSPLAYMRGRTFKDSFIIADEMQNSSPNQMMMLTTRLGDKSRMVITGDIKQSDKGLNSGLYDFIKKFNDYETYFNTKKQELINYNTNVYNKEDFIMGIKLIELSNKDIERNPVVSRILDIYNYKKDDVDINKNITKSINSNITKSINSNNDAAMIPIEWYNKGF